MSDLEGVIARAIHESGVELTPVQKRRLAGSLATTLRENADVVRMEMELVVWGMVK